MSASLAIDLSAFMACPLPMQVDQSEYAETPIVEKDLGRTGTAVRCQGEGFVQSTDAATFGAALLALSTYSAVDGVDFVVTGLNGVAVHKIAAAACIEGGPHIAFTVLDVGAGVFYRRVRFEVTAKTIGDVVLNSYRLRIATAADRLQRITQSGVLVGIGAAGLFQGSVLPTFTGTYPADQYTVTHEVEYPFGGAATQYDLVTRYQLQAVQLANPLPDGGGVPVFRGEATEQRDRDEQQRLTITRAYDLLLGDGDYHSVLTALRPTTGKLVRESSSYASIEQRRLRCSFVTLESADQDNLLNWTQTLAYASSDDTFEEFGYPGADPIAVKRPARFARLTQSGSAVGLGSYVQPPDPLMETFEQTPQRRFTATSKYEMATEWEYAFLDVDDGSSGSGPDLSTLLGQIGRPSNPSFYGGGGVDDSGGSGNGGDSGEGS